MKFMLPQLLASLVHPRSLLKDGSALYKHAHTEQTQKVLQSQLHGKCGPRWEQCWGEGITPSGWAQAGPGGMGWGRGELSGDFQCWAGENRREGGNTDWAKPCGMTPRKGVNIAGIWRHQRWFSTAGFNSWMYPLCRLWDCTAVGMGANYLLAIPNPCGLART